MRCVVFKIDILFMGEARQARAVLNCRDQRLSSFKRQRRRDSRRRFVSGRGNVLKISRSKGLRSKYTILSCRATGERSVIPHQFSLTCSATRRDVAIVTLSDFRAHDMAISATAVAFARYCATRAQKCVQYESV